jgi:MFS family permease
MESVLPYASKRPGSRYKWVVVGMLWFICFFNYADRQAIFSIFPVLEEKFGFNKAQLGVIGMAFTWVYALSAPLAGQVGDRIPRKLVILAGLYVWSGITGFTALCSKVWHFVLVRGTEGLGETFYFPASMSLISDYHTRATRSRAMSIHQTSVYAGTIGGGALAGWMAQHFGWQSPFVLLAGAGMLLGVVLGVFIREPRRNEAERMERGEAAEGQEPARLPLGQFLGELVRTPTALILVMAFFGANFVALVFLTWMPSFMKEKFALSLALAGLGATFFIQVASMIGSVLGGVLADRWIRRRPGGRILVQSCGLLCGAPFIFLCGYTRDIYLLMGAMTLFGLCKGLYDANIWASLYDVIAPTRRGTAVGLMNMIGWFGGGLGSLMIGLTVNSGISMSVAISSTAVIYLVVATLLVFGGLVLAPRDIHRMQAAAAAGFDVISPSGDDRTPGGH